MQRILVTGANGFVGRRLLYILLQRGMTVRATSRLIPSHPVEGIAEWYKADLADENIHLLDLCRDCQAVIHLAGQAHDPTASAAVFDAVNRRLTQRLAQTAAAAGVQHFIFLSTIKVHGEGQEPGREHAYTEVDTPAPEDDYARSKLAAELALQEACQASNMNFTIIRPPLIFGPGVKGNFLALLRVINMGLPLPLGSIRNRRSLVFVDNLCDLLVRLIISPAAANRVCPVSDMTVSTPELIRAMANALGTMTVVFPCPPGLLRILGTVSGRRAAVDRLTQSLVIDDSAMRRSLGWRPPVSAAVAMQQTADWFLSAGMRAKE